MSMPFYTSPEQLVRDRSEYARKGIARGRSVVVASYRDGICFVAENRSSALHKIGEIYDRIGFAAVGKYNEFETLRVAGVRLADMRGYSYDRSDVTVRTIANAYATTLASIFVENQKPFEVELIVAEVGAQLADDQIYRLTYDGSVTDEQGFAAMGGQAEAVTTHIREHWSDDLSLPDVLKISVAGLLASHAGIPNGETQLNAESLEVAVLDRTRPRRTFKRLAEPLVAEMLG